MAIDHAVAMALAFDPVEVSVERGRLRQFSRVIGETDPVYFDLSAARKAGHPDLPVPPTFFFSMELETPDPFGYLSELGVDLRRVLHGEQSFTYHALAYAGETLTLQPRIVDVFTKKQGTMDFLVRRTNVTRVGTPIANASSTLVVTKKIAGTGA